MRLVFRVDASAEMGLGHVKRCLSLGHALASQGVAVSFVTRDLGVPVAAQAAAEGFECKTLPVPHAQFHARSDIPHAAWAQIEASSDAQETIAAIGGNAIDWVVIDHYSFDATWHRTVAAALNCRIAVIDDLGDRALAADVLIDHNHAENHATKYARHIAAHTTLLGGPLYALLGPGYAEAPRYAFHALVRSIGIFMGGADAGNHSALALHAVRDLVAFDGEVEIVTTPSNRHLPELQADAGRRPRTTVTTSLPDLKSFFARHDLHIGAGGGATWERCCIGAPTLAMIVANNQRHVLIPLQELGVLQAVPEIPPSASDIARETRSLIDNSELRSELADRARRLVDGHGAARVAKHLIQTGTP